MRLLSAILFASSVARAGSMGVCRRSPCPCRPVARAITLIKRGPSAQQLPVVVMQESRDEELTPKPIPQIGVLLAAFVCHVYLLPDASVHLPASSTLWGSAVYLRLENVIGFTLMGNVLLRRRLHLADGRLPWTVPTQTRHKLFDTATTLLAAYLLSGQVGSLCHVLLFRLLGMGLPLSTDALHALQVLGSHTAWVLMAARVLQSRLKNFFASPAGASKWFTWQWRGPWLGWALGGYFASVASYNAIEDFNGVLLRLVSTTAGATESLAATPLPPTPRVDSFALVAGCIAPCLTAPVFEELLYRGFMLPALLRFVPLAAALPLHAALFAAHHRSIAAFLPLSALGLLWAWLYARSGNLLVPILIHAMWNARALAFSLAA
mmetsp:Transcript_18736/g.47876  ORF Transcript_18736/g.47876 Transcript_18736/m.47876 type:complete len:379 (-) Transcript_18736:238-1374(-)